jgi:hypothetical protein
MEEENNNFTSWYQIKEFALDENITLFTVDIHDITSIESLIGRLTDLEDMIHEETNNE